jgi:hypothetical protein
VHGEIIAHIKLILLVAALEVFGVLVGIVIFLLDGHDDLFEASMICSLRWGVCIDFGICCCYGLGRRIENRVDGGAGWKLRIR